MKEKRNKKKKKINHHDQLDEEMWKIFRKARKSLIAAGQEPELVAKIEQQLKKNNKGF